MMALQNPNPWEIQPVIAGGNVVAFDIDNFDGRTIFRLGKDVLEDIIRAWIAEGGEQDIRKVLEEKR